MATLPAPSGVFSVIALTRMVRDTLAEAFPAVWVRGEVTGVRRSDRGHLYFSLKDSLAMLECAMYQRAASRLSFELKDGTEVEAFGNVSVFEPRGRYQLVVEELRASGLGALLLRLEERKRRLQAEGLFDASRKKPLPPYPRRIGLVTSPVGAAVRDMVTVLRARWPGIHLVVAPVRVQGEGAAEEIARAVELFNRHGGIDLLIVGRGGGSLEDLWAFNEEIVVRAIAASRIPVVSAIGHEVDWTLADWVADARAATPSNAAEIAVRDRREVAGHVKRWSERLRIAARRGVADRRRHLGMLIEKYGFRRQRDALEMWQQRVDDLLRVLRQRVRGLLERTRRRLGAATARYGLRGLPRAIAVHRGTVAESMNRLEMGMAQGMKGRRARLGADADRLRALSPRLVLERGYCLARMPDGRLVRTAAQVMVGETLTVEFARGEADAQVTEVRSGETNGGQSE